MGLSPEEAIRRAQREVARLAHDYAGHLEGELARMEEAGAAGQWEDVRILAHDVKGQAATLGMPLVGRIARSLEASLKTGAEALYGRVLEVHVQSIRLALNSPDLADDGPAGPVLAELDALVAALAGNGEGRNGADK